MADTKATIELAMNLIEEGKNLLNRVYDQMEGTSTDLDEMFAQIEEGEITDIDAVMEALKKDGHIEEEDYEAPPKVSVGDYIYNVSLEMSTNGGTFVAYTDLNEGAQVDLGYKTVNGNMIDLAMAEVKGGELAKVNGLEDDNKDIDLYVWGNPYNEDFTDKYSLEYDEIIDALGEEIK